jgi:hypothetical protein
MPAPSTDTPRVRRPAGVSRLGLAVASLASAGTFAVALLGLGGPPASAAPATSASADPTTTDAVPRQVVVKTIYVQLPAPTVAPTARPVVAAPKAQVSVVTRQSGSGGGEGGEQEGDD